MSYIPEWDLPHTPGEDRSWQESDCYWWFDAAAKVGGWHRVGQYVHQGIGQSSTFLYEIDGQRYQDINITVPKAECHRDESGQKVGKSTVKCLSPQVMAYTYEDPDASFDLTFEESFFTPRDWTAQSGANPAKERQRNQPEAAPATGHLEVSGRLTGSVRIGDRNFNINALAHRDRSFGNRNLHAMDVLWFCNGTLGPELSWASMDVRLANGMVRTVGFIARGTKTEDITGMQVNEIAGQDGVTPLRAYITLTSASGSIDLEVIPIQGFMQRIAPGGPFMVTDHSSRIRVDGFDTEGFADLGLVRNIHQGERFPTPKQLTMTCVENGLGDFVPHETGLVPGIKKLLENTSE